MTACYGSGETMAMNATASGSITPPPSPDRGSRRRCARWTSSSGLAPALAAFPVDDELRRRSVGLGKTWRGRESTREEGEVKHGFIAVLQDMRRGHGAAWKREGVAVASTASRFATELLGSAGKKTTKGRRGLGRRR